MSTVMKSARVTQRFWPNRLASCDASPTITATALWISCAWLGFALGIAESLVRLVCDLTLRSVSDPDLWLHWHTPWLAPIAQAAWFFGFGLPLALPHHIAPRSTRFTIRYGLMALGAWSAVAAIPGLHPWAVMALVAGITARFARFVPIDPPRRILKLRLSMALASLWACLFLSTAVWPAAQLAWRRIVTPLPSAGAPNVVLVVLDTVRADHMSMYGYNRATTPRLSTWADKGVRFNNARATTPYTLGTHASMFTGLPMSQTSARANRALDGRCATLAEALRDRGYDTAGFVGNIFYGSARYGLSRGFNHYHDTPGNSTRAFSVRALLRSTRLGDEIVTWLERKWRILRPMQRQRLDASELNAEIFTWLDADRSSHRPKFLFVNYFDAHSPYSLPAHAPQPYSTRSADVIERSIGGDAHVDRISAESLTHVRNAYDDGIAWIDANLDALLRGLESRGVLKNSVVIVTADHGEMLGEHDFFGHGQTLHREVVHVPLLILRAGQHKLPEGVVIDAPVSVRDLPATVADLLGDKVALGPRFPGASLRRHWEPREHGEYVGGAPAPIMSELEHMPWMEREPLRPAAFGPMWLLFDGRHNYIRHAHDTLGTRELLYDLATDPAEELDVARDPAYRSTLERMRAEWVRQTGPRMRLSR